jgi:hypothetical protein
MRQSSGFTEAARTRTNPQERFIVLRKRLIEVPDFEDLSRFRLAIDGGFHVG